MKIHYSAFLAILALGPPCTQAGELKASRLIEADQVDQQLAEASARLSIGERQFDPFGQLQDTESEPPELPTPGDKEEEVKVRGLLFAQVVDRIPLMGVSPKQKQVLIDDQFYKTGDVFPVRIKGRNFQVEVNRVAAEAVDFRNIKTNEIATKPFKNNAPLLRQQHLRKDFEPQPGLDLN